MTKTQTQTQWLASNWIHVLAAIGALYCWLSFYTVSGFPGVTNLQAVVTKLYPLIVPIGIVSLLRYQFMRTRRRGSAEERYTPIVFFIAFFVTLVWGLSQGVTNVQYVEYYGMFVGNATAALSYAMFFIFAMAFSRAFVARSLLTVTILVTSVISLMALSPIGAMISPVIETVFATLRDYVLAGIMTIAAYGISRALISHAIVLRIISFAEKIRA